MSTENSRMLTKIFTSRERTNLGTKRILLPIYAVQQNIRAQSDLEYPEIGCV